jgi:hypothetical protein
VLARRGIILGGSASAVVLMGFIGCAPQASQLSVPATIAQGESLQERLLDAIDAHREDRIVDVALGEGEGAWDPAPRLPEGGTTQLLWVYQILAESYSDDPTQQQQVIDAMRYYDGKVDFGHRKHFIDRALALDPGPLQSVRSCEPDKRVELSLPLETLRKKLRYGCPLHEPAQAATMLKFFSPRGAEMCAGRLEDGSYVVFGVVGERARRRQRSGPQAQGLPAILTISSGFATVLWPDPATHQVTSTPLAEVIAERGVEGYTIYAIDPDWQPPAVVDQREDEMLRCSE